MSQSCLPIATEQETWFALAVYVVVMVVMITILCNQEEIWAWIKSKFRRKKNDE